jgi:hypothetical protein
LQTIKTLDVATAASLLAAAAAMTLFEHKRHGEKVLTAKRLTYAFAFMLGAFAARGWWRAFREAAEVEGGVVFSDPRVAWVLAVASLGAPACFAIDRSLERTVREASSLRRHMYRHKRA